MFRLDRLIDLAQNPSQEKLNLQNIIGCCDSWNRNWWWEVIATWRKLKQPLVHFNLRFLSEIPGNLVSLAFSYDLLTLSGHSDLSEFSERQSFVNRDSRLFDFCLNWWGHISQSIWIHYTTRQHHQIP